MRELSRIFLIAVFFLIVCGGSLSVADEPATQDTTDALLELLAREPGNVDTLSQLYAIYMRQGDYREAQRYALRISEVAQENGLSCYTVNGERHELEMMDQGNYPSGLYVKDGDVYVGGWYLTELNGELIYAPCYWKNGEGIALAAEYACPYAIYVDEDDNVWLAGAKGSGYDRCAAYWKNDEPSVDVSSYNNGCAGGIVVVDGNTIIVGFEGAYPENTVLKYWINGEETAITDGTTSCYCEDVVII